MGILQEREKDEFTETLGGIVMNYAETLGSFTRQQAYLMITERSNQTVDKLLYRMKKMNWIWQIEGSEDRFTLSPMAPFDEDMAKALWPVLVHKGDVPAGSGRLWIGKGSCPAKISYLLDGKFYDVILLGEENRAVLIYVEREYETEKDGRKGVHKYVFVVPERDFIKTLPKIEAPHIFAVVDEENEREPVSFLED